MSSFPAHLNSMTHETLKMLEMTNKNILKSGVLFVHHPMRSYCTIIFNVHITYTMTTIICYVMLPLQNRLPVVMKDTCKTKGGQKRSYSHLIVTLM